MAGVCKAESTTEIKCDAHKFFEYLKYSFHNHPEIYPEAYTDGRILEGDGESVGSLRQWNYILPGTTEEMIVKARTTKQDDENMIMVLFVEEGSVRDHHKHFQVTIQVTAKGDGGSLVTWTMEYEKHNEEMPDPHLHFEMFKILNERVDAHIHKE